MEDVIGEWHAAVNSRDHARAAALVTDPIVVFGPKGAGPISAREFARWIVRSGITLVPHDRHQVDERVVVVEEDASWPDSSDLTRVATVFQLTKGKVSAALRKPDLASALALAAEIVDE